MKYFQLKRFWLVKFLFYFFLFTVASIIYGQELPLLKISDDKRYFVTENNDPFFWLGDTAWELIHRLTKDEVDIYLGNRAEKGFTVIQTVIIAEFETPNHQSSNLGLPAGEVTFY